MTLPGLPRNVGITTLDVVYDDVAQSPYLDVDPWAELNSPSVPVFVTIIVAAGVTVGGTDELTPAMDLSGFADGSRIFIYNDGAIQGKGGDGGLGDALYTWENRGRTSGCGGGGAGVNIGLGAGDENYPVGTRGLDGSASQGGAGGTAQTDTETFLWTKEPADPGVIGGNAIKAGAVELTIDNVGNIWAGGGGGGGGGHQDLGGGGGPRNGGAGGDPGMAGVAGSGEQHSEPGGEPGLAIQIDGTTIVWISGDTSPNLEGLIGA